MRQLLNKTFFKFLFNFLLILLVSFFITGTVAKYTKQEVNNDSQVACDTTQNC